MMGGFFCRGVKAMSEDCPNLERRAGTSRVIPLWRQDRTFWVGAHRIVVDVLRRVPRAHRPEGTMKDPPGCTPVAMRQEPLSQLWFNRERMLASRYFARVLAGLLMSVLATPAVMGAGDSSSLGQVSGSSNPKQLKKLSLEQLGNVEVVTANKWPTELWDTPSA